MNEHNTFISIADVEGDIWQVRIGAIESYERGAGLSVITTHDGRRHTLNPEAVDAWGRPRLGLLDAIIDNEIENWGEGEGQPTWLPLGEYAKEGGPTPNDRQGTFINCDHIIRCTTNSTGFYDDGFYDECDETVTLASGGSFTDRWGMLANILSAFLTDPELLPAAVSA